MKANEQEKIKLKPCPFCGSEARLTGFEKGITNEENSGYWYVHCLECGANVYGSKDKSTAIACWNKRVEE